MTIPKFSDVKIGDKVKAVKSKNLANKSEALSEIRKVLNVEFKAALGNAKTYKTFVTKMRDNAKSTLDAMEKKVVEMEKEANPMANSTNLSIVKAGYEMIQGFAKEADDSGKAYMDSSLQFRGNGWYNDAKECINDIKDLDNFYTLRAQSINENKTILALKERTVQYEARAKLVYKKAKDVAASGQKETGKINKEVGKLADAISKASKATVELIYKENSKFTNIDSFAKKSSLEKKEFTVVQGIMKHLDAGRKEVKGLLKTTKQQQKRMSDIGKGHQFLFGAAITKADGEVKAMEKAVSEFDSKVKNALKEEKNLAKKVS